MAERTATLPVCECGKFRLPFDVVNPVHVHAEDANPPGVDYEFVSDNGDGSWVVKVW